MRERKNARQTFNFLMPACLIVCNCSYSFSLQLLFKQDIAWLHQRKLILTIAVFGCFTMKWVLWPNAPIIGGWAVLFTPRKYIFWEYLYRIEVAAVEEREETCMARLTRYWIVLRSGWREPNSTGEFKEDQAHDDKSSWRQRSGRKTASLSQIGLAFLPRWDWVQLFTIAVQSSFPS